MSVIVYELNEIPKKILDFYANSHPNSAFAYLRDHSKLFETSTADVGGLSPWITWPTMHRGVSNLEHEISDLGQNLSEVNKEYPILETVPESHETEFKYSNCVFHYSRTSKDDVIYAPSGEVKKRNYMIQIWSYYSSDEMITNLSNHVLCAYAKSKVNENWTQKLYTHENNVWKENGIGRNKRKITSVILKHDEHIRIDKILTFVIFANKYT